MNLMGESSGGEINMQVKKSTSCSRTGDGWERKQLIEQGKVAEDGNLQVHGTAYWDCYDFVRMRVLHNRIAHNDLIPCCHRKPLAERDFPDTSGTLHPSWRRRVREEEKKS